MGILLKLLFHPTYYKETATWQLIRNNDCQHQQAALIYMKMLKPPNAVCNFPHLFILLLKQGPGLCKAEVLLSQHPLHSATAAPLSPLQRSSNAASCSAARPTAYQRHSHPVVANWNLPLTSTSLLFSLFVPTELLPLLAVSRAGTTEICWSGIFTELQVASTCLDALYLHSPRVAHLYNCSYPLFAKLSSK